MIRRDYILRMIEEFVRALARIHSLKQGRQWPAASAALDEEFKRLVADGAPAVARLSETELLARLMQEGPTQVVRDKTFMLTTLLKEAGDVAAAQGRPDQSRECYLKALHLLLDTLGRGEVSECPAFVPQVEGLVTTLDAPLPLRTYALLMQHYERTGEFAKAEDALFGLLDAEPDNDAIMEFGIAFYQRLETQSDAALKAANLPRAEVEDGLKEMQRRRQKPDSTSGRLGRKDEAK
jgi:tetratricopeptide (TPR) repeat protein